MSWEAITFYAIAGVCVWWGLHQQAYVAGRVDRPFFSFRRTRPKPKLKRRPPPRPGRSVERPGGNVVIVAGRAVYRRQPSPPPKSPEPEPLPPPKPEPLLMVPKFPKRRLEVPSTLLYKLDRYTGDREVSNRLVQRVADKHPGRDGCWCAEKALWDIERDRR